MAFATGMTTFAEGSRAVSVAYFLRIPNVGDLVNSAVVEAAAQSAIVHARDPKDLHVMAIGSVMAGAGPRALVWGTGVMHPKMGVGRPVTENIFALRGPLSHAALRSAGVAVKDIPFGDPGYLAPQILGIQRATVPQFKVGLVPHYVDKLDANIVRLAREDGVQLLDVHEAPELFLQKMAECEVVLSSSLHGLIFAEALRIRSLWIKATEDVAGGGFKFHDWFATTRQPQLHPVLLSSSDTAFALARQAQPHESTIDAEALVSAFPRHRLEEISSPITQRFHHVDRCRVRPTPVFLISYNRGEMLERCIAGIQRQDRATEIVVHDNGSTDPKTIAILDRLASSGVRVVRRAAISGADDLNLVNQTVQEFFVEWGEPSRYIVSDCDVDISIASPNAIDLFDDLLNQHRRIQCVGPMLRIRDIPRDYPLFNRVINRHVEQFWQHVPVVQPSRFGEVAFLQGVIDTTFALHRAGEPFVRKKTALRVYEPFEALHLDWYLREADDDDYTCASSPEISHWNNIEQRRMYCDEPLHCSAFNAVKRDAFGSVQVYPVDVADLPMLDKPESIHLLRVDVAGGS